MFISDWKGFLCFFQNSQYCCGYWLPYAPAQVVLCVDGCAFYSVLIVYNLYTYPCILTPEKPLLCHASWHMH